MSRRERVVRENERNGLIFLLRGGMGDGSMVFEMGKWDGWKMSTRMGVRKRVVGVEDVERKKVVRGL